MGLRLSEFAVVLQRHEQAHREAAALWIARFRGLQDSLGELNDLEVLRRAIALQLPGGLAEILPELSGRLRQRSDRLWSQWRHEACRLQQPPWRHRLRSELLGGLPLDGVDLESPLTGP